ncbi:MAG: aminoacetone oxidase family FAD-binding enzyme [Coriobacteriia bacterium]|nr:aminoacetone oxidase family FAD-binding enzyme [Coriobacteriia bacterium]
MSNPSVLVVGGGASGLAAAISAARSGADVTILEANTRLGKKILATGNGRCNLTNTRLSLDAYNHSDFVAPVLARYSCDDIRAFFDSLGLLTYADEQGRVYPITNSANSVLNVLRLECKRLGVKERSDFEAVSVEGKSAGAPVEKGFAVTARGGEKVVADALVITVGGGSSILADKGYSEEKFMPILCPIKTETQLIRGLSGIRVKCVASILSADGGETVACETGELLFRDYGVSGIMVFDLSRFLVPHALLSIDFFPDTSAGELVDALCARRAAFPERTAESYFEGMLHSRLAEVVLRAAGIESNVLSEYLPSEKLAGLLKDFRLRVLGLGDAKQAQVTRGGVSVAEFDSRTMTSERDEGLFAAGEVLDIDGRCGGYNLHWAWASGLVAGMGAARFAAGHHHD